MFGNSLNKNFKTSFQPSFALIPIPSKDLSGSFFAFLCPTRGMLSLGDVNMPHRPPHSKFSSRLFLNFLSPDIHFSSCTSLFKEKKVKDTEPWKTEEPAQRSSLKQEDCPLLNLDEITSCPHDWLLNVARLLLLVHFTKADPYPNI